MDYSLLKITWPRIHEFRDNSGAKLSLQTVDIHELVLIRLDTLGPQICQNAKFKTAVEKAKEYLIYKYTKIYFTR